MTNNLGLHISTIISDNPGIGETIFKVVIPGFLVVLTMLAFLSLLTYLNGKLISHFEPAAAPKTNTGQSAPISSKTLQPAEIAAIAATAHTILRTPVDPRKVAAAAAAVHSSGSDTQYRIVSIEKRS